MLQGSFAYTVFQLLYVDLSPCIVISVRTYIRSILEIGTVTPGDILIIHCVSFYCQCMILLLFSFLPIQNMLMANLYRIVQLSSEKLMP